MGTTTTCPDCNGTLHHGAPMMGGVTSVVCENGHEFTTKPTPADDAEPAAASAATTRVQIYPVDGPADLYHRYPGAALPQGTYIELDLEEATLSAAYNDQIGNAIPERVYHGIVRRYTLAGPALQAWAANEIMDALLPLAERVLAGATIDWDGSNHVGRLSPDAVEADVLIHAAIDEVDYDEDRVVHVGDAAEWLRDERAELIADLRDGRPVGDLVAEWQGDGRREDSPILEGLEAYLVELASESA